MPMTAIIAISPHSLNVGIAKNGIISILHSLSNMSAGDTNKYRIITPKIQPQYITKYRNKQSIPDYSGVHPVTFTVGTLNLISPLRRLLTHALYSACVADWSPEAGEEHEHPVPSLLQLAT